MAKHNTNVETILSTLSPEAAAQLREHFRQEVAQEIASGLVASSPSTSKPRRTAGSVVGGAARQRTNDGTERSASQFIRDCDAANPDISAKEVCLKAAEVGLSIETSLVYNVRQLARKKSEAASDEAAVAVQEGETQAKRVAALEKARATKAAKKAEAEAAANAKTAAKSKK
jgi:hypothetical protein